MCLFLYLANFGSFTILATTSKPDFNMHTYSALGYWTGSPPSSFKGTNPTTGQDLERKQRDGLAPYAQFQFAMTVIFWKLLKARWNCVLPADLKFATQDGQSVMVP